MHKVDTPMVASYWVGPSICDIRIRPRYSENIGVCPLIIWDNVGRYSTGLPNGTIFFVHFELFLLSQSSA